jgi:S-adenosylmethionine-diacylgycerolhomoserine-N-methlytransferase
MILTEPRILWRMLLGQPTRGGLAERLEGFYAPQADRYDATRESLLHGRRALAALLEPKPGSVLVELGAGTGSLPDRLGERSRRCERIYLVDLCRPLLDVARRRVVDRPNVTIVEADAAAFRPPAAVDTVVFSYSLSMMPDWHAALENAFTMLKPGGVIAVTDFYVSRRVPPTGLERHGPLTRSFWPAWFDRDGVRLNPDVLPLLMRRFEPGTVLERLGSVPGLPFVRVPYFVFLGRKPLPTRYLHPT